MLLENVGKTFDGKKMVLNDFSLQIGGGCYFVNEGLDSSELTFLVDSIFSSPAISQGYVTLNG